MTFTSLLLVGCTSPTAGIRKFYLLSLRYNPESKSSLISDLDSLLSSDRGPNGTFNNVRIGYRGVCVEARRDENATDADWHCGWRTPDVFTDLAGDPLDLLKVADLYKDRISFSTPLWAATVTLAVAALLVIVNCIPAIPIPAVTRKIASAAASFGMLLLLGCMMLQQVTSSTVDNLVTQLGVGAIDIDIGYANVAFGWAAFACSVLAAVGVTAVAAAEAAVVRAQTKAELMATIGLEKATGGRVDLNDFRQFTNATAAPSGAGNTDRRKEFAKKDRKSVV